MDVLTTYRAFTGNASELAKAAIEYASAAKLDIDSDKTNERLIRYYQSEGVLDRPDRLGRDSTYHYRHLVQLLNARRMVMQGLPLAMAIEHNSQRSTDELEANLKAPLPNAAELLVSRFKSIGTDKMASSMRQRSAPSRPPMAVVDVLAQVQDIKKELMSEIHSLRDMQSGVLMLRDDLERQLRNSQDQFHQMRDMLEHLHRMHRRFEEMLMKSIDQHQEFEIERKKDRLETHESIREVQLHQNQLNTLLTLLETKLP